MDLPHAPDDPPRQAQALRHRAYTVARQHVQKLRGLGPGYEGDSLDAGGRLSDKGLDMASIAASPMAR